MPHILVSSVVVQDRIRKEIKQEAIEELADSISRIGKLIHPIVLRDGNVLVAGGRRLLAHEQLGWDQIEYRLFEDLSDQEALAIELEENIKRTDLTWQEQCNALIRLHDLKRGEAPAWTQADTAKLIGISQPHVSKMLDVAKELDAGNVRVASQPKLSTAMNIVKRNTERKLESERASILDLAGTIEAQPEVPFLNVNFIDWIEAYDGAPFNFIHCDFPYGIDAQDFGDQGGNKEYGGYEDSFETYQTLLATLVVNREKLMGESAHLLFWFSMKHYDYTLKFLKEFFWVDPYPLIWHKSDNKGTLPDYQRGPRRIYEVAFLCSHGDRKIVKSVSNLASFPTIRSGEHMSEKSQDMLQYFFGMLVDEHTRMLDPTAGSGSAIRAAAKAGAQSVLGLEMNEEFYSNAVRAWRKDNA